MVKFWKFVKNLPEIIFFFNFCINVKQVTMLHSESMICNQKLSTTMIYWPQHYCRFNGPTKVYINRNLLIFECCGWCVMKSVFSFSYIWINFYSHFSAMCTKYYSYRINIVLFLPFPHAVRLHKNGLIHKLWITLQPNSKNKTKNHWSSTGTIFPNTTNTSDANSCRIQSKQNGSGSFESVKDSSRGPGTTEPSSN